MASAIRRQYLDLKARHPDAILFFRLGDFYETFDADAELVSQTLGVTLTSKPMGQGLRVPLAGVPVQSVEGHLARLIAAGHRVAIAEQLEEPGARSGAGKRLVRRGIVRVVSPGTALEPSLLEAGRNAYCAAISIVGPSRTGPSGGPARAGVALADLSTGELRGCELEAADADAARAAALAELERLGARELLLPAQPESGPAVGGGGPPAAPAAAADEAPPWTLTPRPRERFAAGRGAALLRARFGVADVQGLGLAGRPALLGALGALLDYLGEGQGDPGSAAGGGDPGGVLGGGVNGGVNGGVGGVVNGVVSSGVSGVSSSGDRLAHLGRPQIYDPSATMRLDAATRRALDIFPAPGGGSGSLLGLLDRCRTAAGRRLLRARLERPLIALAPIEARQARVALLHEAALLRARLRQRLGEVPDLERLLGRVATGLATPPELAALGRGLDAAAALAEPIEQEEEEQETAADEGVGDAERAALLRGIRESLPEAEAAAAAIAAALAPEPELFADARGDGAAEVLRAGYDAEVDALRLRRREGRRALAALEAEERRRTGVAALKVGFHRSFGYYIELGRSHAAAAPPDWERRQTLAGGERYVSPRLRALERELLEARDALALRERELYTALCRRVAAEAAAVRRLAAGVARLDAEAALAEVAAVNGWTRPQLDHSALLEIREGRHPLVEAGLVEAGLGAGRFVPNDVALDGAGTQLLVVTGPNMAGKSTYLRQTALIVLLAQIGGFVPAARARLGLVDRIFARVGAQDEIAAGRSTFMVEMLETAAICSSATPRSLLVLDEIGRGTSTYDGLAIARALLEHLVSGREGPRTLFATHFHELAALAGEVERVANASVLVGETPDGEGLRYLYRIVPGGADRSYGVHVAAMAGLPAPLLARARELLAALESGSARGGAGGGGGGGGAGRNGTQPRALPAAIEGSVGEPLLRELAALDVDGLTPLEAIGALYALRERARALASGALPSHEQAPGEGAPGMPPPQLLREVAR